MNGKTRHTLTSTFSTTLQVNAMRRLSLGLQSACLLIFAIAFQSVVLAQSTLSGVTGVPPDATEYPIPGAGFVNLNNGNLHIDIPLRTVKDRNGIDETTSLVYDNSDFLIIQVPNTNGDPTNALASYPGFYPDGGNHQVNEWASGLRITTTPSYSGQVMYTSTYVQDYCNPSCTSGNAYSGWQYIDGQGTVHPLDPSLQTVDQQLSPGYGPTGLEACVTDGSGYWMVITNQTNAVVYDLHGNIVYNGTGAEDTNGNLSSQGYDKLGRPYYALPSGWTVTNKNVYIWTGTGYGFDIGNGTSGPIERQVIGSITRPDGRSYTFQYDDAGAPPNSQVGHYGTLTGITLPTGGQIAIQSEWLDQGSCALYVVQSIQTPDGTWSFSYPSGTAMT